MAQLPAPQNLHIVRRVVLIPPGSPPQVKIVWDLVPGADQYLVWDLEGVQTHHVRYIKDNTLVAGNYFMPEPPPGTTHEFTVEAIDAQGNVGHKAAVSYYNPVIHAASVQTPTSAPGHLLCLQVPGSNPPEIELSWPAVPGATEYRIQYDVQGSSTMIKFSSTCSMRLATPTITTKYEVQGQNSVSSLGTPMTCTFFVGASVVAATAQQPFPNSLPLSLVPQNVQYFCTLGFEGIRWDPVPGATDYEVGYWDASPNSLVFSKRTSGQTEFNVSHLSRNTWKFRVSALVGGVWGVYSTPQFINLSAAGTPPGAQVNNTPFSSGSPQNFTVLPNVTPKTIVFDWSPYPGAVEYEVSTRGSHLFTATTAILGTSTPTPATPTLYEIVAIDAQGNRSLASDALYDPSLGKTVSGGTNIVSNPCSQPTNNAYIGPNGLAAGIAAGGYSTSGSVILPNNFQGTLIPSNGQNAMDRLKLTWDPVPGATHYAIHTQTNNNPCGQSHAVYSTTTLIPAPTYITMFQCDARDAQGNPLGAPASYTFDPNATRIKLPIPTSYVPIKFNTAKDTIEADRCECGAHKALGVGRKRIGHSSWCPWCP